MNSLLPGRLLLELMLGELLNVWHHPSVLPHVPVLLCDGQLTSVSQICLWVHNLSQSFV